MPHLEEANPNHPRVVIVGAGFGGLFATRGLARTDADITLVDQHNYHLFQPLLYQVATASLAPSDIAWPIRNILSSQDNVTVLLDRVSDVDMTRHEAVTAKRRLPYDYLVIATGARHHYFGQDDWARFAPDLKSVDDATSIRRRILLAFERAEMLEDPAERERFLTFVIVGGGPTGVELAGTMAELARYTLAADFRRIDSRSARVILVEGGERLLPTLGKELSDYALKSLEKLGVEVRLETVVTGCDEDGVIAGGERLHSATVLWAAGVSASPAGKWLRAEIDGSGRVVVDEHLAVPGAMDTFVIGDTAAVKDEDGNAVPGIAPAAKQQGKFVARVIRSKIRGEKLPPPFVYRHGGNLATIGRKSAVIEFPRMRFKGVFAWCIWGIAHIYFLIGVRSPILVATHWLWQYITYSRGARLITGNKE